MKIKVKTSALIDALSEAKGYIGRAIDNAIIDHVMISAADSVELYATDLEVGIMMPIESAEVIEQGECVVPHAELACLVKNTRSEWVEIERGEKDFMKVSAEDMSSLILSADPIDFPEVMHSVEGKLSIDVSAKALADMLSILVRFVDESHRVSLQGVNLDIDGDKRLRAVSTDGHRMGMMFADIEDFKGDEEDSVLIHTKAASALIKSLSAGTARISIGKSRASVEAGGKTATFTLIEATFPDFSAVIPSDEVDPIRVKKEDLLASLKIAGAMVNRKTSQIVFQGDSITAVDQNIGEVLAKHPAEWSGSLEDVKVGVNHRYLKEAVESVSGDDVFIEVRGKLAPMTIHGDDDSMFLVMPMRL